MKSDNINELAAALVKAQAEYKPLKRECVNPYFKSKYASLDAVIESTAPALRKNGLVVIQTTEGDNLITTLAHSSGQWIQGVYPLHAVKNDPQGIGSAVTYARRYSYCAIVQCAPSDEDDDGNGHAAEQKKNKKPEVDWDIVEVEVKVKQLIESASNTVELTKRGAEIKKILEGVSDENIKSKLRALYAGRLNDLNFEKVIV